MVTKHENRPIEINWDDDAMVWVGKDLVTGTMSQNVTYRDCLEAVVDAVRLKAKHAPSRCNFCDARRRFFDYEMGSGGESRWIVCPICKAEETSP